jgi:predicted SAM-dependent methyltransferase
MGNKLKLKLELGAGANRHDGWQATDLVGGADCLAVDVTQLFPFESDQFDYIYSEHMIEHLTFEQGQNMLRESYRVLKPGGVARIVTPSLDFVTDVTCGNYVEYKEWSIRSFVPDAPELTNAFFFNNFVRAWGHTFIYDTRTLMLAMELSGFRKVTYCYFQQSEHAELRGLESAWRLPPGFLKLESMIYEGTK